jgi:hypothetical protein
MLVEVDDFRTVHIRRSFGSDFCDRKLGPLVPNLHQIQKGNNLQASYV